MCRLFYERARNHALLSRVFAVSVADWERRLAKCQDFWSRALLGTERYSGFPFPVHMQLPVEPEHFSRWLALFEETATETLGPAAHPRAPSSQLNSAAVALAQQTRARVRSLDGPPRSTSGWSPLRWAPAGLRGRPAASRAPIFRLASISTGGKLRNRTGKLSTRTWQANFGIAPKRCFEAQRDFARLASQAGQQEHMTPNPIDTRTQARTRHKVEG